MKPSNVIVAFLLISLVTTNPAYSSQHKNKRKEGPLEIYQNLSGQARDLFYAGNYKDAIEAFISAEQAFQRCKVSKDDWLLIGPRELFHKDIAANLAKCYFQMGDYEQAKLTLLNALNESVFYVDVYAELARLVENQYSNPQLASELKRLEEIHDGAYRVASSARGEGDGYYDEQVEQARLLSNYYSSKGMADESSFWRSQADYWDNRQNREKQEQKDKFDRQFGLAREINNSVAGIMSQALQNKITSFQALEAQQKAARNEALNMAAIAELIRALKPAAVAPASVAPSQLPTSQTQPKPPEKKSANEGQAQNKRQSNLPIDVLNFTSNTPQGTQQPCGDYKGYQIWEQRVNYTLVNPNDIAAEVKFMITIKGKAFNYSCTVQPHQTYTNYKDFNIGCDMYNPGIQEARFQIVETKIIQ
jgi:tetratricopeptide (TPR) repeat protein